MRRALHLAVAVSLVLALAASASAADKGKKKAKPVRGTVESIQGDTLKVTVPAPKKNPDAKPTTESFTLTSDTKFEKVTFTKGQAGEKPTKEVTEVKREDLKAGEHVQVTVDNGKVTTVSIVAKHKKNKK